MSSAEFVSSSKPLRGTTAQQATTVELSDQLSTENVYDIKNRVSDNRHNANRRRNWWIGFAVLVIVVVAMIYVWDTAVSQTSLFTLKTVEVRGNRLVSKEEILRLADVEMGGKLGDLDLNSVANRIRLNPVLSNVTVARNYPSALTIVVREIEPFALLAGDDLSVIGANGLVFPAAMTLRTQNLPVLSGINATPVSGKVLKSEQLDKALRLLADVRTYNPSLYQEISEVNVRNGELTVFLNVVKAKVLFGTDGSFVRKVMYLESVINYARNISALEADEIDLRYSKYIIMR